MKQYIELSNDAFINYRFVENKKDNVVDWVDKDKRLANGKNCVDTVTIFMPVYDNQGYNSGSFQKYEFTKGDILKLASTIMHMDSKDVVDIPPEDLPF